MTPSRSLLAKTLSTLTLTLILGACSGDSPESLIASSKDFLAKNDSKAAVIQLKNALQQNPNIAEARFLLGSALLENGDPVGAEVELRRALDLKYPADAVVPLVARTLLLRGQAKALVDEFGSVALTTKQSKAALATTLSAANAALGKVDKAKALLDEALAYDPEYVPARLAEVRALATNKDIAGAQAKIDTLLGQNPNNPEALLLSGALLSTTGNTGAAITQFKKAIAAKPDYVAAHTATISAQLRDKKIDDAVLQLAELKKIAPKYPQTYFLDTQVNYQKRDFKAAQQSAQQLLRVSPNDPSSLQLAGAIEYQLASYLQADIYLSKALQLAPGLSLARRLLVSSHIKSGQAAKAIAALQPILGQFDNDSALLTLAGEAYLQNGDPNKAAEYFAKASKLEPENSAKKASLARAHMAQGNTDSALQELEQISVSDTGVTADLALIAAHLRNNQLDKALKAIDQLEKKQPDNPATHNLRARALLAKKDSTGARKSFEKALSINPSFFPAVASLAALDLIDKKPLDAQKRFEAVLAKDPRNSQAMLALAELKAVDGGTPAEVSALLEKAISGNPTEIAPRIVLIQYHLKNKDNKKALSAANEANSSIPDKPEILDLLGIAQRLSGDLNQASATYGKLASIQPNSPLPYLRLAEIQFSTKSKDEGVKNLKKALEIKPDIIEAQKALIQIAMESNNHKEALSIARTVQKQRPSESLGYLFEGDIHIAAKALPDATNAYREGLKKTQASELAIRLNSSLIAAGNVAEAEKMAATWQKDHPKDIGFRVYQGDLATSRKNFPEGIAHYQAALAQQPNNALALNNLAWASGQIKSPKALEYAQKANQIAPDQPAFMDTLAVLLADKGETGKAIEILRKALAISPQAAPIRLNLAKTLIKAGKKDEARIELEGLEKLGEKFSGHTEVSQLLKNL